jgi:Acetyltransferases
MALRALARPGMTWEISPRLGVRSFLPSIIRYRTLAVFDLGWNAPISVIPLRISCVCAHLLWNLLTGRNGIMVNVREMNIGDFDQVIALIQRTPGVTKRDADSEEAVGRYLERNPGLSLVAEVAGELIGCVMAGHDGRRGYLQHLVVAPDHRNRGIATRLVNAVLDKFEAEGILKSHIDVLTTNRPAIEFWQRIGWKRRTDIFRYSFIRAGGENA